MGEKLIEEARLRGYKDGVKVFSFIHNRELTIKKGHDIQYLDGYDKIHVGVGLEHPSFCVVVYYNGKWAPILNQEPQYEIY